MGKVNYTPFLIAPNSEVMPDPSASASPSSTATESVNPAPSTPEFPSMVALEVVFLVSAVLFAVAKSKLGTAQIFKTAYSYTVIDGSGWQNE